MSDEQVCRRVSVKLVERSNGLDTELLKINLYFEEVLVDEEKNAALATETDAKSQCVNYTIVILRFFPFLCLQL